MTTPEPPAEPTPPSFDKKPAAGGSPYDTPPPPTPPADPYAGNPYTGTPPAGSPYVHDPYAAPHPAGVPTGVDRSTMPPLGGLGTRLLARIIDWVIFVIISVPLILLANTASSNRRDAATLLVGAVIVLIGFVYEGVMLTRCGGQTVGKKLMRIRVAMLADGAVPGGRPGWIRAAVYWLPDLLGSLCLPALFSLLNVLWCVWDRPYQQCLHDKAARTVVVKVL